LNFGKYSLTSPYDAGPAIGTSHRRNEWHKDLAPPTLRPHRRDEIPLDEVARITI
jgi:hypothetical protein